MGLIRWIVSPWRGRSKNRAAVPKRRPYRPVLEQLEKRIVLDDHSVGPQGIDARGLTLFGGGALDGSGVSIGEVDLERPGKPGFDKAELVNADVKPTQVYFQNGPAKANDAQQIHVHAERVAGVMIADGGTNKGVAPKANLYASEWSAPRKLVQRIW
jgi:hypothetical protein